MLNSIYFPTIVGDVKYRILSLSPEHLTNEHHLEVLKYRTTKVFSPCKIPDTAAPLFGVLLQTSLRTKLVSPPLSLLSAALHSNRTCQMYLQTTHLFPDIILVIQVFY